MKKRSKILLIAGGALVVIIVVVLNLVKSGSAVVKVQTEKVEKRDITSIVTATGKVEPKTTVKISANISAKITRLPVKEGDRVKKGQVLVQLEPTRYQAAVNQYAASLAAARAQLRLAESKLAESRQLRDRTQSLFEKNLASKEQHDAVVTAYAVAEATVDNYQHQVEQTEAALAQAQDDREKTTITAPMNGVVTELKAEAGEVVIPGTMNNPGTVILVVSDLSEIEVKVDVDETDIALVKLGQPAKIEIDAFPDTAYHGRVTEIGNSAQVKGLGSQDQVTNFQVKVLLVDTVPNIKPGMTASVDVTTDSRSGVVAVPIQAVVMREEKDLKKKSTAEDRKKAKQGETVAEAAPVDTAAGKNPKGKKAKPLEGVFVVREGTAHFVSVKTGISDQENIEIASGLEPGDEVVVGSYKILRTLEDEAKVKKEVMTASAAAGEEKK